MQDKNRNLLRHKSALNQILTWGISYLSILLPIFLVYSNSFHCSWHFDDVTNIVNNQGLHLKELSFADLNRAFHADPGGPGRLYRPVSCVTFALNHFFGGLNVFGYHVVNLFVHAVSSLFLFLFIRGTLSLPSLGNRYSSQSNSIALIATLLWALHPIQTQAVTYIVQRMSSLAGLFFVMAMYFYLRFRRALGRKEKVFYSGACVLSFLMGFGSKENAALLPISLFLYEVLLIQRESWAPGRKRLGVAITLITALSVLILTYLYYRKGGLIPLIDEYACRPFSLTQRLMTEPRILLFYISLLIYPVPWRFSVAHSVQISDSLFDPATTVASILILVLALISLILFSKKRPLLSFCLLFFFVNHLMESTFLPLELVFEHRNYIPSMLFFVPAALAFCTFLEKHRSSKSVSFAASALVVIILTGFAGSTFLRNFAWKTPESLWMSALENAPDQLRVHHNLGLYYHERGSLRLAKSHYEQALRSPVINRKDEPALTYFQLGLLHTQMGNLEEAQASYQEALHRDPRFALASVNLASILDQGGRKSHADEFLMRTLAADPSNGPAHLNMGIRYLREGLSEEAIFHLKMAKRDIKLEKKTLFYMGIAYKQKGVYGAAILHLKKAIAMDPMNLSVRLHLIDVYLTKGLEREAHAETSSLAAIIAQNQALLRPVLDLISKGEDSLFAQSPNSLTLLIHRALEHDLGNLKLQVGNKNS